MALKVGTRVKVVPVEADCDPACLGECGVIVCTPSRSGERDCSVLLDGYARTVAFNFVNLRPAVDPSADQWAADKVREITRPQPILLEA